MIYLFIIEEKKNYLNENNANEINSKKIIIVPIMIALILLIYL